MVVTSEKKRRTLEQFGANLMGIFAIIKTIPRLIGAFYHNNMFIK